MKKLLLDTNLLLLYIVGNLDQAKVGKQRRLEKFSLADLANLNAEIGKYQYHVSIPNVLSETSNFIRPGKQEITVGAAECFSRYCQMLDEIYRESRDVVQTKAFANFGLTDAAIVEVARQGVTIITDDHPLYGFLDKGGLKAVNIHHHYNLQ